MAINREILDPGTNWENQRKGYVEDGLKDLLRAILEILESPAGAGSVGLSALAQDVLNLINGKVTQEPGKGLSSNDYTTDEKTKLEGIETGAQKNVQADWDAESGDAAILHKPSLHAVATSGSYNDLKDKPVIPEGADLSGYATKAYVDAVSQRIDTLLGSGNVQGAIDTFNEVKAFLDGIDTSDPTLFNQLRALSNSISSLQTDLAGKVDKEDGKSLMTDAERTKLQGLPTNPVTSITVNGQTKTPTNGNVNIEVQGQDGKSAYQSYLETTSDSPVKSEAEWVASLRGADGVASGDEVVVVHNYDGEPSNLEQGQKAVLGADLGPSIGKIFNANTQDANNATPYRLWVGTQEQLDAIEEYDEDVIYLVGTVPTVAQKFNLDVSELTNVSVPANTPAKVKEGSEFSIVLTPASGYTIDTATGTMAGGGTLTKTNNQNGTVTFSTTSVTGAITITASASVHISSVAVSAGTRNVNAIPLTAVLNAGGSPAPAGVTYNWSVPSGTTKFSVTGNGATATLNVLSGAVANDSVVVTCAASNGTSNGSGTVTVRLTEPYNNRVDITALGAVSHADGSDVNTFQFSVGKTPPDGNYPEVVWSLGSCVPAGAASIDARTGLLTVTADCTVTVTATAGNMSSTSDTVSLEYQLSGPIPFADDEGGERSLIHKIMNKAVMGSENTDVTYEEAGTFTGYVGFGILYTAASSAFNNKDVTSIKSFDEWRFFKNLTALRCDGWTNLSSITAPEGAVFGSTYSGTNDSAVSRLYGSKVRKFAIPEGATLLGCVGQKYQTIESSNMMRLIYPSTLTTITDQGMPNCKNVQFHDFSRCSEMTMIHVSPVMGETTNRFVMKLSSSLTTIETIWFRKCKRGAYWVEVGDADHPSNVTSATLSQYGDDTFMTMNLILHQSTKPDTWSMSFPTGTGYDPHKKLVVWHIYDTSNGGDGTWGSLGTNVSEKNINELPANWDKCIVTLTSVTSSNEASYVELDAPYNATISVGEGLSLSDVKVLMLTKDITEEVYDSTTGRVSIPEVYGDIEIKAEATEQTETTE